MEIDIASIAPCVAKHTVIAVDRGTLKEFLHHVSAVSQCVKTCMASWENKQFRMCTICVLLLCFQGHHNQLLSDARDSRIILCQHYCTVLILSVCFASQSLGHPALASFWHLAPNTLFCRVHQDSPCCKEQVFVSLCSFFLPHCGLNEEHID